MTFDITDYYLTPAHGDLVRTAGRALEGDCLEKKAAFEALTKLILEEQYVTSQVDRRFYRCNKGSAIGMRASGGLCDGCLAEREQGQLVTRFSLYPDAVGAVQLYKRFKDDGLMIVEGSDEQIIELIRGWNRMSDWRIEKITISRCDTIGTSSTSMRVGDQVLEVERSDKVAYLDLEVSFGSRWLKAGLLDIKTYVKPTAIKIPLSYDSAHRDSCKCWWPLAESRRFARSCASFRDWLCRVNALRDRLSDYPQYILNAMSDPEIHLRRCAALRARPSNAANGRDQWRGCVLASTHVTQQSRVRDSEAKQRSIVLKLRHNDVSSKLGAMQITDKFRYILNHRVNFRIAWQNPGKHLRLSIRKSWPITSA